MLNASVNLCTEGQIFIEKTKKGVVTEKRLFSNTFLQYGLTELFRLMQGNFSKEPWEIARFLFFGTGDKEPTANDSGLLEIDLATSKETRGQAFRTVNDETNLARYAEVTLYFDYPAGEMTGTWLEMGLADSPDYSGFPINRALIRDASNVPNSLVVEADEALNVGITLRIVVGVQEYVEQASYLSQDRGNIRYNLRSLPSVYWFTGNDLNIWKDGFFIQRMVLLDENKDPKEIKGGWTDEGNQSNASIEYTYEVENRVMRTQVQIPFSANDELLYGFAFGPSTDPDEWMFEVTFTEPLFKSKDSLFNMEIVLSVFVEFPTFEWST